MVVVGVPFAFQKILWDLKIDCYLIENLIADYPKQKVMGHLVNVTSCRRLCPSRVSRLWIVSRRNH